MLCIPRFQEKLGLPLARFSRIFPFFCFLLWGCVQNHSTSNPLSLYASGDLLRKLSANETTSFFSEPFQEKTDLVYHWKKNPGRQSGLPLERKWENIQITFNSDPKVFLNHSLDAMMFPTGISRYSFSGFRGNYRLEAKWGGLPKSSQATTFSGSFSIKSQGKVLQQWEILHKTKEQWESLVWDGALEGDLELVWESSDSFLFLGHPIVSPSSLVSKKEIDAPSVVLIVIDSARKDFYTSYGYPYPITPTQDQLAQESIFFSKSFANGNWTKPSMHSFFHSDYSSNLGLGNSWFSTKPSQRKAYYGKKRSNLVEEFRKRGYFTKTVMNNVFFLDYTTVGIDLGFHDSYQVGMDIVDTEILTKEAIATLELMEKKPVFLHWNLNTPHASYSPPAWAMAEVQKQIPKEEWNRLESPIKRYIGEMYYTDREIQKFIEELKKRGLYKNTIIAITGDHGELFSAEHDYSYHFIMQTRFGHGETHYDEEIGVPYFIKPTEKIAKNLKRLKIDTQASLLSLAPTILGLLGYREDSQTFRGVDYSSYLRGDSELTPELEIFTEGRMSESLRTEEFKYIRRYPGFTTVRKTVEGEPHFMAEELYDLSKDPGELENLAPLETGKALLEKARALRKEKKFLLRNEWFLRLPPCSPNPCLFSGQLQLEGSIYDWNFPKEAVVQASSAKTLSFQLPVGGLPQEVSVSLVNPEFGFSFQLSANGKPVPYLFGKWGLHSQNRSWKQDRDLVTSQTKPSGWVESSSPWMYIAPKFSGARETELEKEMGKEVKKILETWGYIHE